MTEEDRITYLDFCCGMLYGTLSAIRNRVQIAERVHIDNCMEKIEPLLAKVYEFQERQKEPSAE